MARISHSSKDYWLWDPVGSGRSHGRQESSGGANPRFNRRSCPSCRKKKRTYSCVARHACGWQCRGYFVFRQESHRASVSNFADTDNLQSARSKASLDDKQWLHYKRYVRRSRWFKCIFVFIWSHLFLFCTLPRRWLTLFDFFFFFGLCVSFLWPFFIFSFSGL